MLKKIFLKYNCSSNPLSYLVKGILLLYLVAETVLLTKDLVVFLYFLVSLELGRAR